MKTVAVIGLGKFGFYIAKSLSRLNVKVIAVDNDEKKVQDISEFIDGYRPTKGFFFQQYLN